MKLMRIASISLLLISTAVYGDSMSGYDSKLPDCKNASGGDCDKEVQEGYDKNMKEHGYEKDKDSGTWSKHQPTTEGDMKGKERELEDINNSN